MGRVCKPTDRRRAGPREMIFEFHGVNAADHAGLSERGCGPGEARLRAFTQAIVPVRNDYLPK